MPVQSGCRGSVLDSLGMNQSGTNNASAITSANASATTASSSSSGPTSANPVGTLRTNEYRQFGLNIREHTLTVPWVHPRFRDLPGNNHLPDPNATLDLYARELIADGCENKPVLVYLQGGPGCASPRPVTVGGWISEALKHYRVLLLDQRGTGRSTPLDSTNAAESAPYLHLLRQEHIIEDAELLRQALGEQRWNLFGQSFGGFCITTYLSLHPDSVERAYLTGGLPTITDTACDLYRTTYAKLRFRHEQFYNQIPFAQDRIREICHHLETSEEILPTGERLSARRFRTMGIALGRGTGFATLGYLLEDPFCTVKGEKRLRDDALHTISAAVHAGARPLYWVIHESIYGGVGGQHVTDWAAHRVREEIPGFEENLDPRSAEPFYLTGEHVYPWQFEEDPVLRPWREAAHNLAQYHWQESPYDASGLRAGEVKAAACVFVDDIFVPFEQSMATAATYRDLRPHITNAFQHDGIGHDGAGLFARMHTLLNDH